MINCMSDYKWWSEIIHCFFVFLSFCSFCRYIYVYHYFGLHSYLGLIVLPIMFFWFSLLFSVCACILRINNNTIMQSKHLLASHWVERSCSTLCIFDHYLDIVNKSSVTSHKSHLLDDFTRLKNL